MGDFWAKLLELLKDLWPFRPVQAWERGFYTILSKPRRNVGPGIWPVIPLFTDVKCESIAPAIVRTPLLWLTLTDGTTLSLAVAARMQVRDVRAAICDVDDYRETVQELLTALTASRIQEADPKRLDPEKRGRFLSGLVRSVNAETSRFGVETTEVWFTSYAVGVRTYRLVTDKATSLDGGLTW